MRAKADILREFKKAVNRPEKYQALMLEIEIDKRDETNKVWYEVHVITTVLRELQKDYK